MERLFWMAVGAAGFWACSGLIEVWNAIPVLGYVHLL